MTCMSKPSAFKRLPAAPGCLAGVLALTLLPLPARAGQWAVEALALPAGLALLLALAWCWRWLRDQRQARQRAEAACRHSENGLSAARQDGQNWRERCERLLQESERIERERDRLALELAEREQRLAHHVDCSTELVFELDLDGRCCVLSPNWRDALGIDPASLLGQSHGWLLHPDDQPTCQRAIERALASHRQQDGIEYRIRHALGDWRWHAARIAPLLDARARAVGLIGRARELDPELRNEAKAARRAHFDALTDLPGPVLCRDRLQQALCHAERYGERVALLWVDPDRFHAINRRWGHGVGDLVLREVATRLSACVRASDTVGRARADTFSVLLPGVGSEREALVVAEQIRLALSAPLQLRGQTLALTACVGVAVYPGHGFDEDELSERALLALQQAKDGGGNRVALPDRLAAAPALTLCAREALRA
jgi:diguanylate cyclase (GGDEF)-like protein/PAS domain S-box-containing protein